MINACEKCVDKAIGRKAEAESRKQKKTQQKMQTDEDAA